jgi:hypothetical protein
MTRSASRAGATRLHASEPHLIGLQRRRRSVARRRRAYAREHCPRVARHSCAANTRLLFREWHRALAPARERASRTPSSRRRSGRRQERTGRLLLVGKEQSLGTAWIARSPLSWTTTRSAGADSCFLANEQSWRTAWRVRSLLGWTKLSSGSIVAGPDDALLPFALSDTPSLGRRRAPGRGNSRRLLVQNTSVRCRAPQRHRTSLRASTEGGLRFKSPGTPVGPL